jgi:hypothetical protein
MSPTAEQETVERPLSELIVDQIEKRISQVRSSDYEESIIKMLTDILTDATDIPNEQKAWIFKKFEVFAAELTSHDEQRAKNYLLAAKEKLRTPKK